MVTYFIDTNIFLRFLFNDGHDQSIKAKKIIESLEAQKAFGVIHSLVVHEILYIAINTYKIPKDEIILALTKLLRMSNLILVDIEKSIMMSALEYFSRKNIDFPDTLFAAIVKNKSYKLLSFDKDFKKIDIKTYDAIN